MKWDAQDLNPIGWCSHKKVDTAKRGLPRWLNGKLSVCQCRRHRKYRFDSWVRKIPWRRKWPPSHLILAWEIPQTEESGRLPSGGHKESDMTEHTHTEKHQETLAAGWATTAEKDRGLLSPPSLRIFQRSPWEVCWPTRNKTTRKLTFFRPRKRKRQGQVYDQ